MRTRTSTPGVVLLNASYEPLGIVPIARALVFLIRERAVIVDAIPGRTLRSAAGEYPYPRVVQFTEMIRVPYRYGQVAWSRRELLRRDNHEWSPAGTPSSSRLQRSAPTPPRWA